MRHLVLPATRRSEVNPIPLALFPIGSRFDVVHAYQMRTAMMSILAILCHFTRTAFVATDLGGGGRDLLKALGLHRWIAAVFAISAYSGRLLSEELRKKTVIVKGGVDVERFQYNGGQRKPQVVQVGRIMPHKGINFL